MVAFRPRCEKHFYFVLKTLLVYGIMCLERRCVMKENLLIDKSIAFASRIIKLHQYLIKTKKETIISKQIVRSGTSIGANINEANYGHSKADFISKMHIALKETAETEYWLKLLNISEYITEDMGNSLLNDCLEIKRILVASINTSKENNR